MMNNDYVNESGNGLLDAVGVCMEEAGVCGWGAVPFGLLRGQLISCAALRRLPQGAETIIVAVFPYRADTGIPDGGSNLSRYAWAADYHAIVGGMLSKACAALSLQMPGRRFEPFCDASPIPEVEAACRAGLGVRGENGLLITPGYGSFVFIGEIVTDLPLDAAAKSIEACPGCGLCKTACPGGAIGGGAVCKERCVSHLTQQKACPGEAQRALIAKAGSLWGCDICQTVCPMNKGKKETPIPAFRNGLITALSAEELERADFDERHRDRAFMWRGSRILKRNLCILNGLPADNTTENRREEKGVLSKHAGTRNYDDKDCQHCARLKRKGRGGADESA